MLSEKTQLKMEAYVADFEVRGAKAIQELREKNLVEYMHMITDLALAELDSTNQ